jgi:TP901 family phage tail tape measure protein
MSGVLFKLQRAFSGVELSSAAAVATVGAGFTAMAAGIGMVTAGLAGLETAFNLAKAAGKFETEIKRTALIAGGGAKAFEMLKSAAQNAAMDKGFDPLETVKGLQDIAAMGFTAAQSVSILPHALDLAAAGGIGVSKAAESMSAAMKVFGLDAGKAGEVASRLVQISNDTALQANDLEIALGTVGRGAGLAKQNLGEMLTMMGLVKNTGVDATVAASSVSSALVFMAGNAAKFKKLGIDVEDANGHFRNLGDVILDTNRAMKDTKSDVKVVQTMTDLFKRFGVTAFQAVSKQLETGVFDEVTGKTYKMAEALDYLRSKNDNAAKSGVSGTIAGEMLATFTKLEERVSSTMEVLKATLGEGFSELFKPALLAITEALRSVVDALRLVPTSAKKVAAGIFLIASAMTVGAGAGLLMAGAFAMLFGLFVLGGGAMLVWMASFALLAIPLAAAAAAMTAGLIGFGAAAYLVLTKNLGGAADKLEAWYKKWKLVFTAAVALVSEGHLTEAIKEEFNAADAETQNAVMVWQQRIEKLKTFWDSFIYYFSGIAKETLVPAVEQVMGSFGRLADALGLGSEGYTKLVDSMKSGDFAEAGKQAAIGLGESFQKLADAITSINDGLTKMIGYYQTLKPYLGTIIGTAIGARFGGLRGALAGGIAGASVDLIRYGEDRPDLEALPGRSSARDAANAMSPYSPTPFVAAAGAEAEAEKYGGIEKLVADLSKSSGDGKPYLVNNRIYLDGRLIAESVQEHIASQGALNFTSDQQSY